MSSSQRTSSDVLKRIKAEARRLAEIDYQSNLTKNKSAFISRMTSRHYTRLLKKYYEDGEKQKRALRSMNAQMSAGNAQLRNEVRNLNKDLQYQELSRKLEERRRRRWLAAYRHLTLAYIVFVHCRIKVHLTSLFFVPSVLLVSFSRETSVGANLVPAERDSDVAWVGYYNS